MDESKELLEEQINRDLKKVQMMELSDAERSSTIDNIVKMYRLKLEAEKTQLDFDLKWEAMEEDNLHKQKQLEIDEAFKNEEIVEKKKTRWFKFGTDSGGIILPLILYGVLYAFGLEFEESGTFTSQTFKNLLGKIKPTR